MKWSTTGVWVNEHLARSFARGHVLVHAILHPEFSRVLTAGERREQYADEYARTIMRLTA